MWSILKKQQQLKEGSILAYSKRDKKLGEHCDAMSFLINVGMGIEKCSVMIFVCVCFNK